MHTPTAVTFRLILVTAAAAAADNYARASAATSRRTPSTCSLVLGGFCLPRAGAHAARMPATMALSQCTSCDELLEAARLQGGVRASCSSAAVTDASSRDAFSVRGHGADGGPAAAGAASSGRGRGRVRGGIGAHRRDLRQQLPNAGVLSFVSSLTLASARRRRCNVRAAPRGCLGGGSRSDIAWPLGRARAGQRPDPSGVLSKLCGVRGARSIGAGRRGPAFPRGAQERAGTSL